VPPPHPSPPTDDLISRLTLNECIARPGRPVRLTHGQRAGTRGGGRGARSASRSAGRYPPGNGPPLPHSMPSGHWRTRPAWTYPLP